MKSRLWFAAISLMLASPAAHAESELETLRARCAEQERQIRQLEQDNARLRGGSTASQTTATPAEKSSQTATSSPSTYVVKPGDSLERIARRSGMSPAALAKANGLKTSSIIHPGQKLRVTGNSVATAKASTSSATPSTSDLDGKTYQIRSGDTYSSIARRYKTSAEALIAANPSVKPSQLRVGQTIQLGARKAPASAPAPAPAPAAMASTPKPAPKPAAPAVAAATPPPAHKAPTPSPAPTPAPIAKTPTPAPAAPAPSPAPATPTPAATQTVSNPAATSETPAPAASSEKKFRPITIEGEMTYGDFATKHGTSTERLNSLNGLDLTQNTVLAKGSELYVPAQP